MFKMFVEIDQKINKISHLHLELLIVVYLLFVSDLKGRVVGGGGSNIFYFILF
jgi:hypothetical protein